MFQLPIEYDPGRRYSRQEMKELIEPHVPLLCFFATVSQEHRCVLGLDFDGYDPGSCSIPVHVIPAGAVKQVIMPVHGKGFKRAYRTSRVGKDIIVTYSAPGAAGWFRAGWELGEEQVFANGSGMRYP